MNRDVVLEGIRAALGQVPRSDYPEIPAPRIPADPVVHFIERAQDLGVQVVRTASVDEAAGQVAAWCGQRGARRAAVWTDPDLAPIVERLRTRGVEVLSPGAVPEAVADADVGITGADWAVAETATLVLASAPDRPRITSLLPPIHLALLRADRIVPHLSALFARLDALPSALTLITGPSRSADIGLVPVLGAHGPTEVTVVLLTAEHRAPTTAA
ncbi:MAG: lactate utilization protein [Armatimonadota bacterium]|nr:lactate utilization protein [Armatimonadota bacterium]MDR7548611.1 lactate utilization protein [Armatimonadota bacterium]